jgi:hypothetical protein
LAAWVQSADATILQYTVTQSVQKTELNYVLSVPKFDLSLGTLTGVTISYASNLSTVLTVQDNSLTTNSAGVAKTRVKFTLDDPFHYLTASGAQLTQTFGQGFSYSLSPGGQLVSTPITQLATFTQNYTSAAVLSEFSTTGDGTVDLTLSTKTTTVLTNSGGNTAASQVTEGNSTMVVTYTYDTLVYAPEPSSMAALMIVAGASIFSQYRRRRNANTATPSNA